MSRTGRKLIPIPEKVKVALENGSIRVEGPLGKLSQTILEEIQVEVRDKEIEVKRKDDLPITRSRHGLTRALIANMVHGVSEGFKKELDIQGVGYRADVKGQTLNLTLGYSHPIAFPIPEGIQIKVDKQTHLIVSGADKSQVGQVASNIKELRPPEPYKGKGVRYSDEKIRRKAGKSAAAGAK